MKRILMITASAGFGGGPQHVYDLAESLRGDVMVDIVCPRQEPFYARFRNVIDGELLEIPERRFTLADTLRIQGFARRRGTNLLHSHGKGAGVYGRFLSMLSGLPLVHTPHGIHVDQYGQLMRLFYLGYERVFGALDARTIFVSPSEMERARSLGIGRESRSTVICNGVPTPSSVAWQSGARERIRASQELSRKDIVVATLSRFNFAKNMEEMVQIAERERSLRFWFIGDGPGFEEVNTAVKDRQMDHVWLPGFVDNPLDYLAAADVYCSTSRWEGMSLGILQAMSVCLPIVASNVPGNCDAVIHGKSGYLYTLGNLSEAVKYIKILATDARKRKSLGKQGKKLQQSEFSLFKMAKKTVQVYSEVIKNNKIAHKAKPLKAIKRFSYLNKLTNLNRNKKY